jgi:CBS domain-containing protein
MPIESLRVRDHMNPEPRKIAADTPIMDAVKILVDLDISGLIVVDRNDRLEGILTERDCIRVARSLGYFDETAGTVADYMTPDIHFVGPEDSLMDVADTFINSPFRRCPVVEDGRVVGLILRREILSVLIQGQWFAAAKDPSPT